MSSSLQFSPDFQIRKPDTDDRSYRLFTLPNSLEVLVISDPHTETAAAALDVHVGHLCDPNEFPGLAHFCEHLLFMGTEKYPQENDYSEYLSKHSGYSNAYTAVEHTNYYFSVGSDFLEGALDRFAQFFIAPLFSEGATERELNAVDSEHKKNLQSDSWRIYQLEKDLSSPTHPFNKFGTGNLETLSKQPQLQGLDIRKALLEFHDKYYSSNIMKLSILGKESLDELSEWAVEKFKDVKNKNIPPPSFEGHPLTSNELLKKITVNPVKEMRHLEITFPFPDMRPYSETKPERYLSHLIGHESEGSILTLLKSKGWAVGLSAGYMHGGINFGFFKISVDLSQTGLENYEDVVIIIFQYIKMLVDLGIQEYIYEECKSLAEIEFRFKEKSASASTTSKLATQMHQYTGSELLSGPYMMQKFDAGLISEILGLLRPDNFRISLLAPVVDVKGCSRAKYYGTEYQIQDLSPDFQARLNAISLNKDLHLPLKNDFLPTRFDVRKLETKDPYPKADVIKDTPLVRLWYNKDDTFYSPKASVWFKIFSPLAYATPLSAVHSKFYVELVKDALSEFSYMAEVAGLSYNLENDTDGFMISLEGYNDKIAILLARIVHIMKTFVINPERFNYIKEFILRGYRNFNMESPHSHAMYYASFVLQEKLWTNVDKLAQAEAVTLEHVQAFFPPILEQCYIEGLVYGNVEAQEALSMANILEKEFKPSSLPHSAHGPMLRTHIIPPGTIIAKRNVPNEDNVNSAIEYYLQVGDPMETEIRGRLSLLAQILSEPCFDQLRTKEQLGYMVHSGMRTRVGITGFRVIIQSTRDPVYLESRVDNFLSNMEKYLNEMTEETFEKHKKSVILHLTEKEKNMSRVGRRIWGHVSSGFYFFNQQLVDAEYIPKITKQEILDFYASYLNPANPEVRRLVIHMKKQGGEPDLLTVKALENNELREREGATVVSSDDEILLLKDTLDLGKGVVPVIKIEPLDPKTLV